MEATKKMTKKEMSINWLMTNKSNTNKEEYKGLIIVKHSLCSVAIWEGKSNKPMWHYRFNNSVECEGFIQQRKDYADKQAVRDSERLSEYSDKKKGYVVGAILCSSWGYEQTNIDWYIILERKNDYILIQEIGTKKTYDNNYNDRGSCLPDATIRIGDPFKKKITKYASINLESYKYCALWDGQPKSWSSYA